MNSPSGMAHFLNVLDPVGIGVLSVLIASSVATWTIIVLKTLDAIRRVRVRQAHPAGFHVDSATQAHAAPDDLLPLIQAERSARGAWDIEGAQRLVGQSVDAEDQRVVAALYVALEQKKLHLERGQSLLAIVANSAPFVGLTGTVWGIYHALLAVSSSGQTTLDQVAGPVGEALLMTGFGIAVAIPASVAYNVFGKVMRVHLQWLEAWAHRLRHLGVPSV